MREQGVVRSRGIWKAARACAQFKLLGGGKSQHFKECVCTSEHCRDDVDKNPSVRLPADPVECRKWLETWLNHTATPEIIVKKVRTTHRGAGRAAGRRPN